MEHGRKRAETRCQMQDAFGTEITETTKVVSIVCAVFQVFSGISTLRLVNGLVLI